MATDPRPVAALYVDPVRGPYGSIPGVDPWDAVRDATGYQGPHPVVAHPPCAAWGRMRWRSTDDGHTGPVAVAQVRRWGGVLEHPAGSALWAACGMPRPGEEPDEWGGWTLATEQCRWGHRARKATWFYVVGVRPENMPPVPAWREPTHVIEPDGRGAVSLPRLPKSQRHVTPPALAAWLVSVARRARPGER